MQPDTIEIPVGYLTSVIHAAKDIGLDLSGYLASQCISKEILENPDAKINGNIFKQAILHAQSLYSGEKPLSLEIAKNISLTSHGTLSLAILCAPNVRVATNLAKDYSSLVMPYFFIELQEKPETSFIRFSPKIDLGEAIEPIMEVIIGAFYSARLIFGSPPLQIYLEHTPKSPLKYYEDFWNCKVSVNQSYYQIALQTSLLDKALPTSNKENFNKLKLQLDEQYNSVLSNSRFKLKIQEILSLTNDGNFSSLDEMADELFISARTLRRKLENENSTYKQLVNQARQVIAERNLKNKDKPIKQIYRAAGFASEASFSNAFKSWTGKTPLQFRNEHTD